MINMIDIEAKGNELKKAILETGEIRHIAIVNKNLVINKDEITFDKSVKETFDIVLKIFLYGFQDISMDLMGFPYRTDKFDQEENAQFSVKQFKIASPAFDEDAFMVSFVYDFRSEYIRCKFNRPEIIQNILFQEKDKFFTLKCDNNLSLFDLLDSNKIQRQINKKEIFKLVHAWRIKIKIHVPNLIIFDCLKDNLIDV